MGKIAIIKNRIYSDFIMPPRLDEYERVIKQLVEHGYIHTTFREYKQLLDNNKLENKRYFVNRHDIDTDIATAKEFFKIEKKYGVKATYYFRLSTLDIAFMQEIENYGSEASYHFEEIAQYCKDQHIKTKEEAIQSLGEIKELFSKNFKNIEKQLGFKMQTVCSHGDFVNRKLKIINNEITKDENLRKRVGILCEAYDKDIMQSFDIYVSDKSYPVFYSPKSIFEYIGKVDKIYMLTHPRQWKSNFIVNSVDNAKRVVEGLLW